jgi:hypothetical protein
MRYKHNQVITFDHFESYNALSGWMEVRKFANKLKDQNILDGKKEKTLYGIAL